ncbi:FAD:protein FMN transferase [Facklamia sp. DSM 111018]|uniref:FAD:protein FMN transferase n=2 Tax=Facklamia lactis TaxID=2749967 RepID=A0ABS0LR94_9LACT|nr:FAD:protein FMN transferase [Facklamia lactis]MBG9985980.1 FAD:protein FMN transferase [Facklamia lactis]
MGTNLHLKILHQNAVSLLQQAKKILLDYNQRYSTFINSSQLQQINLNAGIKPVQVDQDLFDLIAYGREASIQSKQTLNIAIGPLVKLWKIGFGANQIPDPQEIEQVLKLINPQHIKMNSHTKEVYLEHPGMAIDLGALAKGYFADNLKKFFIENGVKSGFIDLGGNVLTIGGNPERSDSCWRIGIQDPQKPRGQLIAAVKIQDLSLVTSGIYERVFRTKKGELFHHILDSHTGYPVENQLASVSILSPLSLKAEEWTTRLFYCSPQMALEIIEQTENIEGLIIDRHNNLYLSQGMKKITFLKK